MGLTQYIAYLVINLAALGLILVIIRGYFILISSVEISAMRTEMVDIRRILQANGMDQVVPITEEQHIDNA